MRANVNTIGHAYSWIRAMHHGIHIYRVERVVKAADANVRKEVESLYDMKELEGVLNEYVKEYPNLTRPACWYAANRTYEWLQNLKTEKGYRSFDVVKLTGVNAPNGDPDSEENDPWNLVWLQPAGVSSMPTPGRDPLDFSVVLYSGSVPRGKGIYFMRELENQPSVYPRESGGPLLHPVTRWVLWHWVSEYSGY